MSEWLQRMQSTDPLSREQEAEIFVVLRSPEAIDTDRERALDRLVKANVRFSFSIALEFAEKRRHHVPKLDIEQLFSASYLGLVTAAQRFDPSRGYKFITYAVWWIRQSLYAESHEGRTVHLPTSLFASKNKIPFSTTVYSLDNPAKSREVDADGEMDTVTHLSMLEADDQADKAAYHGMDLETINEELGRAYTHKEQLVVKRYFGLDGEPSQTLDSIGQDLGVTRERVRQIRDGVLVRLRSCPAILALKVDILSGE